ncbi:MAG: amino acid permease C-terminal domain-containing protein, partial [Chitinophagales bacterium]
IPLLFTDKTFVLDFTSIATLFAFVLVCGGVLLIPRREKEKGRFHLPHVSGRYLFPLIVVTAFMIFYLSFDNESAGRNYVANLFAEGSTYAISTIIFWITCFILSIFSFTRKWNLIPLMGVTTCLYLLTGMTAKNWLWFGAWLLIGLVIYLLYGYRKSKLNTTEA